MLIQCPECELQVSDKAMACPHCGYPMKPTAKPRKPRNKNNKRRRLPNGFGQISEIKNRNLRKPFRAMITVGKNSVGRPICKPLKPESYFETYNDAYSALVEYNKNPYDLDSVMTVKDLYKRWSKEHFKTLKTANSVYSVESAWKYCSAVYSMKVTELRARHIKGCVEDGVAMVRGKEQQPNANMKNKIKTLFNQMLDYAVEYELVDRNYARTFNLSDETIKEITTVKNEHIAFTDYEMDLLWNNLTDDNYIDLIIIQCYSGWRPQELCLLETKNINIDNWTFTGGMKTDSGMDRNVPIHSRIQNLVKRRYDKAVVNGTPHLFTYPRKGKNTNLTYNYYHKEFTKIKEELGLNPEHRPHDGRKHFVTMAKKYKVDEYAIKYMVGHKISDITEKIYTERESKWLREEIEKIK